MGTGFSATAGDRHRVKTPVDAERLVNWAYADQVADLVNWSDMPAGLASSSSAIATVAELLTAVDLSRATRHKVDPDAVAVDALVEGLGKVTRYLLIRHGIAGTAPGWRPGARFRCEPVYRDRARRRLVKVYDINRHWIFSPIVYRDQPELLEADREHYRQWHAGLVAVASHFEARPEALRRWIVEQPRRSSAPWALVAEKNLLTKAKTLG